MCGAFSGFLFSPFAILCSSLCISVMGACLLGGGGSWLAVVVRFYQLSVQSPS